MELYFLCISVHLTVLVLSNPVLNLIFLLLPITSSHSNASVSDSTIDFWRYISLYKYFIDIDIGQAPGALMVDLIKHTKFPKTVVERTQISNMKAIKRPTTE